MEFYKIKLAFKGSRFLGWQKQKDFTPTVQGELEAAISKIFKSKEIKTVGSGRTDTGVHSLGHVAKLQVPFSIEPSSLVKALNSNLPEDIRVLEASACDEGFLPTNHAIKKEYRYLFTNNDVESPFQRDMIANYPYPLDFEAMHEACKIFIGEWDFKGFSCAGSDPASTIRTVYECELTTNIEANLQGIIPNYHCIRIVGNGFLKQMVRLIVGSVWHVGKGKLGLKEIEAAVKMQSDRRVGEVAPPQGLYKVKTWY